MIINIPTNKDFENTGKELLNHAWENVSGHLNVINFMSGDKQAIKEYLDTVGQNISTSLSICQQGIEFLLKGKIAEVSPFLLLSGSPRDWPKGCNKKNTPFSHFRTLDAQDLIRTNETVCKKRFSEKFKEKFEYLRKKRNTIMHSVSKDLEISLKEIILAILESSDELIQPQAWSKIRWDYHFENIPNSPSESDVIFRLFEEYNSVIDLLSNSESKQLLGYDKGKMDYLCPYCSEETTGDYGELITLAQRMGNKNKIQCLICLKKFNVVQRECADKECNGDLVYKRNRTCLTCEKNI